MMLVMRTIKLKNKCVLILPFVAHLSNVIIYSVVMKS